jgi:hypothetical protein
MVPPERSPTNPRSFSLPSSLLISDSDVTEFHVPAIAAVAVAFFVKLCLFLYCWGLRQYSQVRILWEDHRNDLFINGFGIMTSVLGSKIAWWIDPMGATILAFLIIGLWGHTAYRTVPRTRSGCDVPLCVGSPHCLLSFFVVVPCSFLGSGLDYVDNR